MTRKVPHAEQHRISPDRSRQMTILGEAQHQAKAPHTQKGKLELREARNQW